MIEHPLTRDDVDLPRLADELGGRLGRTVALSALLPKHAPLGEDGALRVVDDETGELLTVDPGVVAEVIATHRPPAPVPDPLDVLAAALEGATTILGLRAALLTYAREAHRPGPPPRSSVPVAPR